VSKKFLTDELFKKILEAVRNRDHPRFREIIDNEVKSLSLRDWALFLKEVFEALGETQEWLDLRIEEQEKREKSQGPTEIFSTIEEESFRKMGQFKVPSKKKRGK